MPPPVVLSIGGFDPSSGAGVTADIKTLAAHGCYGVCCITALTVQSTKGVRRVEPVAASMVRETLDELADDVAITAVRIGMLGTSGVLDAVADFLRLQHIAHVVLDPILKSSSGAELFEPEAVPSLVSTLLPRATVITPNLAEAAALTGLPVNNIEQMRSAAQRLHEIGAANVVITGGHLTTPTDLLSMTGGAEPGVLEFAGQAIATRSTHGTGCAFATALAANLALGRPLPEAVLLAKQYVAQAMARAYPIGQGAGPLHHLFGR
jgi:hydroxymethylpyrimidine/phosphomethylpyrimidine kinase